ncbi:hypothetical protein ELQ39_06095 [Streptomyces sp. GB4-14]|uniref:hypothetical protein n=1 Tax=Streptomyces TaxID=1883 RepID=UPI001F5C7DF3|nr:hypothetical protein [Streptomyces sp. GB4-14]
MSAAATSSAVTPEEAARRTARVQEGGDGGQQLGPGPRTGGPARAGQREQAVEHAVRGGDPVAEEVRQAAWRDGVIGPWTP